MHTEAHLFPAVDWCPNNANLSLLIYRMESPAPAESAEDLANHFETQFRAHDWRPAWRYTIYDFAHYHSNTHEVIGVYRGFATIRFGDIKNIDLKAGDVVVIPAGVSHQRITGSEDFTCVGAYPKGSHPDQIRKDEPPKSHEYSLDVPTPEKDPLTGEDGFLPTEWGAALAT